MPNCKSVVIAVAGLFAISESLSSTKPLDHHMHVTSNSKVHSHDKEEQRSDVAKHTLSHSGPTMPQALHETKAHRRSGNISGDHTHNHYAPKAESNSSANASSTPSFSESGSKVRIEVFYETLCPYCEQLFMEQLKPLWDDPEFSQFLDVGLYPSGNMMTQPVDSVSDGYKFFHPEIQDLDHVFQCQHGPDECLGNMIQACTMKAANNMSQALPLIFCMALRTASGTESMEKIAYDCLGEAKMDLEPILQCVRGPLGNRHMFDIGNYSDNLLPPKQWVPWVTLDGEVLEMENSQTLAAGVCKRLPEDARPAACAMADEPEEKKPLIKRLIPWLNFVSIERSAALDQPPGFCHPAHGELKLAL